MFKKAIDFIINILLGLFQFLKLPLFMLCVFIIVIFIIACIFYFKLYFSGLRRKKSQYINNIKQRNFFQKIFIDFPKMLAWDFINAEADKFNEHGMIIFTGRQGKGKTISLVHYLDTLKDKYQLVKCTTNFGFEREDKELETWRDLTDYVNGLYGVAIGIDETQNWFSSSDSRNFPPEMLEIITQNRKNCRVIGGTAQNFYLLSKAIRTQTTEVRECHTFFKCITFVFKKEPILDYEGNVLELKNRGSYFYVHTPQLREKYDTYKAISRLSSSGFISKEDKLI